MDFSEFIINCCAETDHHRQSIKTLYEKAFKSWIDDFSKERSSEPRVLELKRLGLTSEDGFFIWSYTGSSSSWLNCDKRNGNNFSSSCKQEFATHLEKGLRKLPIYIGKVWRWEEADDEMRKFNWFKENIGLTIVIPYFLSTGKDNITSEPMLWEIQTIDSGNARDISTISNNAFEAEVLFLPNAKFKITGVGRDNKTVFMQELHPDSEAEFELSKIYYDIGDIDPDMIEEGLFD